MDFPHKRLNEITHFNLLINRHLNNYGAVYNHFGNLYFILSHCSLTKWVRTGNSSLRMCVFLLIFLSSFAFAAYKINKIEFY